MALLPISMALTEHTHTLFSSFRIYSTCLTAKVNFSCEEVKSYQMKNSVVPTFHVFRRQIRVSFVWPVAYEIISLRNAWCSSELRSAVRELLEC